MINLNIMLMGFTSSGVFESIQLVICKIASTIPILETGKGAETNKLFSFAKITQ